MYDVIYKNHVLGQADSYKEAEELVVSLYGIYNHDDLFIDEHIPEGEVL